MQCFLCVWRKSMASVHFSVLVHFVWVGQKLTLAKQRFPFFLGGEFFFNQHSSCDLMWSPNKKPVAKKTHGKGAVISSFQEK